jgi:ABC-type antimicrobial peptide transport system permease subunit
MNVNNDMFHLYKTLFRNIEKAATKCVNLKGAIKFNRTCLTNGLYPTYVKIKLRGRAVTNNNNADELQNQELLNEINIKTTELEETEKYLTNLKEDLKNQVINEVYESFTNRINEIVENTQHNLNRKHMDKLNRLYNGQMFVSENNNKFINLSTHQLTTEEREVLNLGLNCHIQRK